MSKVVLMLDLRKGWKWLSFLSFLKASFGGESF